MQAVLFLILLTSAAILAQSKIGDQCGPSNQGRVTAMADCKTKVVFLNAIRISYHAIPTNNPVCCIEDYDERCGKATSTLRKSEQACADFGRITPKVSGALPTNAAQIGEYPYNVIFGYENGSHIANPCIAHCISHNVALKTLPITIRLGSLSESKDAVASQDIPIAKLIRHPNFKPFERFHDIGLIKLAKAVTFTENIQPACLYTGTNIPKRLTAPCWGAGKFADGEFTYELSTITAKSIGRKTCSNIYAVFRPIYLRVKHNYGEEYWS
ncbi:Trypsin [Popillia japonica]|uniref:Trypsin n=1 Tax=Popillia japonica TaxID=7064 RepID=A0AAW1JJI4_POPJA